VKPDAAMSLHNEATHNEATVVGTAVREFSKILLQRVQRVHGNAIGGPGRGMYRLVIKNTAHVDDA
jgi:hypothetical protein